MGYLICEKCGMHYKLKEGESADDFIDCECGGDLKEVEKLEDINDIQIDKPNKKVSNEEIKKKSKSIKNKNNPIDKAVMNYWNKQSRKRKSRIIIALISILLLSTVGYAIFSPKITPLSINSPISLENNEIGKYSYDFFSTNSTDKVVVSGKTDPNAQVKVYVTYGNTLEDANEFYSSELMNNQSIPGDIQNYSHAKNDPGTDGYESGRPFDVLVDKKTGNFNLEIPLNPNFGHAWVYIVSLSPKKEHNMIEVIVTIPKELQNVIQSNSTGTSDNTTTSTSEGSFEDYDRGYDQGYFSGINEAYDGSSFDGEPSSTLQVSDMWKQGFRDGYKQGYEDIQNGNHLQKPRLPGTAIKDPRTGENIYA